MSVEAFDSKEIGGVPGTGILVNPARTLEPHPGGMGSGMEPSFEYIKLFNGTIINQSQGR